MSLDLTGLVLALAAIGWPLLILIAALLALRVAIATGVRDGLKGVWREEDLLLVLQRRYARGEIDEAEYARRREVLLGR